MGDCFLPQAAIARKVIKYAMLLAFFAMGVDFS
jgi:hypothetical protein